MTSFKLDPTLNKDSFFICDLKLCQLRLIDNSNFPWVILIPKIAGLKEIIDLSPHNYKQLNNELFSVARIMHAIFTPDKLNIATIGNVVSQLHMHIVVRYVQDKLYPKTVWGDEFARYSQSKHAALIDIIKLRC